MCVCIICVSVDADVGKLRQRKPPQGDCAQLCNVCASVFACGQVFFYAFPVYVGL